MLTSSSTTYIYTLSLHDALPISHVNSELLSSIIEKFLDELMPGELGTKWAAQWKAMEPMITSLAAHLAECRSRGADTYHRDRKSTRLNSSHRCISYAVFCLKKKT